MRKKNIVGAALLLAAVAVFAYSSYSLFIYFNEARKEDGLYSSIREIANGEGSSTDESEKESILEKFKEEDTGADTAEAAGEQEPFPEDRVQRKDNLLSVYEQNEDTVGWVTIRDTAIDYPVMQSLTEPDFYLKHDFDKKESAHGCIYMDAGISLKNARNRMLYGHHMKSGSMFASLVKYDSIDYCREHPIIEFDTLSSLNDYQVIGAFKAREQDLAAIQEMFVMNTEDQFDRFKEFLEKNRFYDTGVEFSYEDRFITLMTCEYTYENGRFFVVGKLVRTDR